MKAWQFSAIFTLLAGYLSLPASPSVHMTVDFSQPAGTWNFPALAIAMKPWDICWIEINGAKAIMDDMKTGDNSLIQIGQGVAQFEVPEGHPLSGYPNPQNRLAGKPHGPLEVNALFIERNGVDTLLVSVDALGLAQEEVRVIKNGIRAQNGMDPENIFISCTHTHSSGTSTRIGNSPRIDEAFLAGVTEAIFRATEQASRSLRNATVKVGSGEVSLGHNRRVVENGQATNVWLDPDRKHTGPVDDEVGIISFRDENDDVMALLLNYSCHPVAFGPPNKRPSADFPGYAREKLRQALGNIAIVYTTGAGGDINPLDGLKETPVAAKAMGEALAGTVLEGLPTSKLVAVPDIKLRYREDSFIRKSDQEPRATEFLFLAFGDDVAFISLPGEPLVELGLQLKALSRYPKTYVLGYTNDYLSYLVTRKAVKEGGYEASKSFNDAIEDYIMDLGNAWLVADRNR